MKTTSLLLAALLTSGYLMAAPTAQNQSQSLIDPADVHLSLAAPAASNQIKIDGLKYEGILVQVATTQPRNLWQLVNPFAPAEYGRGTENLHRDVITGQVVGFKFFSISF